MTLKEELGDGDGCDLGGEPAVGVGESARIPPNELSLPFPPRAGAVGAFEGGVEGVIVEPVGAVALPERLELGEILPPRGSEERRDGPSEKPAADGRRRRVVGASCWEPVSAQPGSGELDEALLGEEGGGDE